MVSCGYLVPSGKGGGSYTVGSVSSFNGCQWIPIPLGFWRLGQGCQGTPLRCAWTGHGGGRTEARVGVWRAWVGPASPWLVC